MKYFYLILIAFFTLTSCSKDDDKNNEEVLETAIYTLELNAAEELQEIKVDLKMVGGEILETFSVTNSSSISVDFKKDEVSVISAEITDSSPTPVFRYKIFAKCGGEVLALVLDKGKIGKGMSEFTSQLTNYTCENF